MKEMILHIMLLYVVSFTRIIHSFWKICKFYNKNFNFIFTFFISYNYDI